MKDQYLNKIKKWYDDIPNVSFTPDKNGVHVRFMDGFRHVHNLEPWGKVVIK